MKTLLERARSADRPKDCLLQEANSIIQAIMDGRVDIKRIKEWLDAYPQVINATEADFFEQLEKIRENRRKWGVPKNE
jgi:5S rRNA maturation endonuclease (ribonuclease M5)